MKFASRLSGRSGGGRPREHVVPLINVVFLLLVFFMLTATLRPPDAVPVELPVLAGTSATRPAADRPIFVLDAGGRVLGPDGRPVGPDALRALRAPDGLEIRADRDAPARALLPLLEELDAAGVPHVDLVTRRDR